MNAFMSHIRRYLKHEKKLIAGGVLVGVILSIGVWLVALDDLGARLATVGAFIAAILTPLLASVVNGAVEQQKKRTGKDESVAEEDKRNIGIIILSAVIALVVALSVIGFAPRVVKTVQGFFYQSFNTQMVHGDDIRLEDNLNMGDGSVAAVSLPSTKHHYVKIIYALSNDKQTTFCKELVTLKTTTNSGDESTGKAGVEQKIKVNSSAKNVSLKTQLIFASETDPSCRLNLSVAKASFVE